MSASVPNRQEQRDQARAERKRREQEDALRAQRKRRLTYLGGGVVVLIALVAIVIAVASGGGSGSSNASGGAGVKNAAAVTKEFAGIPQSGNVLGASNAKATMMVFADLQCPFCAEFDTHALPSIVSRYVRPGKLKIEFQPISIIGNDSVAAARATAAAGLQNKLFQYSSLFYYNQGKENTGYVTDAFLTKIARATPGLTVSKWKADLNAAQAGAMLSRAQSAAQTAGVNSTPTFMVAKSGRPLEPLEVTSLTPNAFNGKLDALTK